MQEEEQQSSRRKSRGHEGHSEGTDHLLWLSVCDFKDSCIITVGFFLFFFMSFSKLEHLCIFMRWVSPALLHGNVNQKARHHVCSRYVAS